jgi:hypothetical protein
MHQAGQYDDFYMVEHLGRQDVIVAIDRLLGQLQHRTVMRSLSPVKVMAAGSPAARSSSRISSRIWATSSSVSAMTNLLDTIQSDILGTTPLSDVLRKAMVLAFRLKNQELKDWVDHELNSYPGSVALPDYRLLQTGCFGTFSNGYRTVKNIAVPWSVFPEGMREQVIHLHVNEGIRSLESMLESSQKSESGTLHMAFSGDLLAYLSDRVIDDMACLSAWRVVTGAAIAGILDAIRNRLLTLTLELADRYPEAAKQDFNAAATNPSSKQLEPVIQYIIYGDSHTFQAGPNPQHHQEALTVSNEVTMGDGNTFQGDFVVAHSIEQSFNRATESDLADPVKELLKQLVTQVGLMSKELSPEEAQQVARDVAALTTEATSKTPRKQWIQLSGEGLIKAATNIGKVGVPVIELVNKALPLLTG